MTKDEAQIFEALKEKIGEYESLLKEIFDKTKVIAKVVAGPIKENDQTFYRVKVSGTEVMLVSATEEELEVEQEVVVNDTCITRSLPKKLVTVKKTEPFKKIGWEEVGGLKSQVQEIRRQFESQLKNASLCKEFGVEPSKGALLYGPPGCGKTLISRVIASSIIDQKKGTSESFVYIKGPELLNKYVGSTEENIRKIFKDCRNLTLKTGSRSVIFIDEAESLLSRRGTGISSDMNSTVVPQFLAEMDGFDEHSPFVLLSTNIPQSLDPAIVREGRIDLKIEIKRPTKEDAVEIFQIHLNRVKVKSCINKLSNHGAEVLYGTGVAVSGSMIRTIANMAAQEAMYRYTENGGEKGIIENDLSQAITKIANNQIQ